MNMDPNWIHIQRLLYLDSDPLNIYPLYFNFEDPNLWIRKCKIKVKSGSVWRDTGTNPDPDPGHIQEEDHKDKESFGKNKKI